MKKIAKCITGLFSLFAVSCSQAPAAGPLLWDRARLESVKKSVKKDDSAYRGAYDRLIRRAETELGKKAPSVTDKPMTPPSGDKRDYMSLGRYWWPNPDTPDGLPYVRRDGHSNPELGKFDRERLGAMAGSVVNLSLAWYFSGDERYAEKALEIIDTWFLASETRMNPNMNYGQTIPGHNGGRGRAEGVIDTYSLVPLTDAVRLLDAGGKIGNDRMTALRQWFSEYVRWLDESEIGRNEKAAKNNHGLAYDVQLAVFADFAGNDSLATATLKVFPERRLFRQIEPDGSQPLELARTTGFGYSVFNIRHMLDMCDYARSRGYDLFTERSGDGRNIGAAIDFLTPYLGKTAADFPFRQIKNWEQEQQALCGVLYRAARYDNGKGWAELYTRYGQVDETDFTFTLLYR